MPARSGTQRRLQDRFASRGPSSSSSPQDFEYLNEQLSDLNLASPGDQPAVSTPPPTNALPSQAAIPPPLIPLPRRRPPSSQTSPHKQDRERESAARTAGNLQKLEEIAASSPTLEAFLRLKEGIAQTTESAMFVTRTDLQDVREDLEGRIDHLREVLESWRALVLFEDKRVDVDTGV